MCFINLAANYSNPNYHWQDWCCLFVGGELMPRDCVGYSERIAWELICRKRWMIFLETGGTFELWDSFQHRRAGIFLYWLYKYSKNVIRGIYFDLVDKKYRMICAWCINSAHRLLLFHNMNAGITRLLDFSGVIQNVIVDWQPEKKNMITVTGTMVLAGIWASLQRDLCGEFSFLRLFIILAAAHTIS